MEKIIKIGTRDSKLAVYQAYFVKNQLEKIGYQAELVFIKSDGDKNRINPLYEMGIEGVFTRTLDIALLEEKIDIAVHSLKDVPTKMAKGIILAGVPKRGEYKDILVYKGDYENIKNEVIIGTSSLRRQSFWLNKYPHHKIENLRGNIPKRLEKVKENSNWFGGIFAKVALERLEIKEKNFVDLDFMLPAPAQGAIGIACLTKNSQIKKICEKLNDKNTEICVGIERKFLNLLEGGCSMPIGTLAEIKENKIIFNGSFLSIDGKEKYDVQIIEDIKNYELVAKKAYEKLIENPKAKELLKNFRLGK